MNLVACGIIIFCSTFVGFRLSAKCKQSHTFFYDLVSFCATYSANLQYRRLPLESVISQKCYGKQLKKVFDFYLQGKTEQKVVLSAQDEKYVGDFFRLLGKSDAASQLSEIKLYKEYFETRLSETEKQYKDKGELYKRLGVLSGLLICILLI